MKIDKAETFYYIQFHNTWTNTWVTSTKHDSMWYGIYHDTNTQFIYGWIKFANTYKYENIRLTNALLTINIPWCCFDAAKFEFTQTQISSANKYHWAVNAQTRTIDVNNSKYL